MPIVLTPDISTGLAALAVIGLIPAAGMSLFAIAIGVIAAIAEGHKDEEIG